jgi:hypothetical protein
MKRLISVGGMAVMLTAAAALIVGTASPSQASWAGNNCAKNRFDDPIYQRKTSQSYAAVAVGEGYEWGGGCWNDNNRDDTPGAPDSGGEGPDCSGFTFKSWEMKNATGGAGGEWYDKLEDIHGPYSSYDFHSPVSSDPFSTVSKSSMQYMDAFAKDGHVAMLSSKVDSSSSSDWVYEALGDSSGTDLNFEGYRGSSSYSGVKREGWTADCYPNCGVAAVADVVLP